MLESASMNRFNARFVTKLARKRRRADCRSTIRGLEVLESRDLLATFIVTNLRNAGTGSFRQAIIDANLQPGADIIDFSVAGTIRISGTPLPAIKDSVTIDGTQAPGFSGSPVVTINFQGSRGLDFANGSGGSTLISLSLIRAGNSGVTLSASNVTLEGNDIGIMSDGTTVAANRGDGVRINASSHGDLIGRIDPVSSVDYDPTQDKQVVGIGFTDSGIAPYRATVNTGFQLSNVISGNGGNGIGLYGSSGNTIAMNNIGTDSTGTLKRGNAKNGILITDGASANLIGGQATGGNDPTADVIVRPPQGNLISGNRGNGVLITGSATLNTLSGNLWNFRTGDSALGNRQDGVAIVKASGNQLIGCTFQQSPFVFYNVLSGNGGNGLRITNSNNTTVQANFMGAGADNSTVVANGGDGLMVSGTSRNTQVGGVIPLGNVISGNDKNGIEETGRASGLVSFNTFAGTFAFGGIASNKGDGILITSSGGNNQIRTCLINGNLRNGIELGGSATGVQVTDTTAGFEVTNDGILEIPNLGSGIKIDGRAHHNAIGGFQPSVEPQVTISDNDRYGIEVVGSAHDNVIVHTDIGTNYVGLGDMGNKLGGIYLGQGTSRTTIGGSSAVLANIIHDSGGSGVKMRSSSGNTVSGNQITSNTTACAGRHQLPAASIGSSIEVGNQIANQGFGFRSRRRIPDTLVQSNLIAANPMGNVNLTKSRGVTYIP